MGCSGLKQAALAAIVIWTSACAPTPAALSSAAAPGTLPLASSTVASSTSGFILASSAFDDGANIPTRFTCAGEGTSPQIHWSGVPVNTHSFALIMDDPDAPGGTFTHWIAFDLPATESEIAEGAVAVGKGGRNGRGQTGYAGPCPPFGNHRYFLTLYALDVTTLGLNDGAERAAVEKAIAGHILGRTQLMGLYSK